jgi:hypothetical protein
MNKPFNPINRPISPELESLLSPSAQHLLSDDEKGRKVIPVEDRQDAMRKIGTWLTGAETLPGEGEIASLKFNDGHVWEVKVEEWGKTYVGIEVPGAGGGSSTIDTRAFINLAHEPHQPEDQIA